jgi:hypothetical protein
MQSFRNLKVWDKAHRLTLDVYQSSRSFRAKRYTGLRARCSGRPHRLVRTLQGGGSWRGGAKDFGRFLQIATGSASELEYPILLAHDLELM